MHLRTQGDNMAEPTAHLVDQHLSTVADAIRALISEDMLNREQFRAAVRTAYRCLVEADTALKRDCRMLDAPFAQLQARVQLAAINLNTAVAAYRAAWSST